MGPLSSRTLLWLLPHTRLEATELVGVGGLSCRAAPAHTHLSHPPWSTRGRPPKAVGAGKAEAALQVSCAQRKRRGVHTCSHWPALSDHRWWPASVAGLAAGAAAEGCLWGSFVMFARWATLTHC